MKWILIALIISGLSCSVQSTQQPVCSKKKDKYHRQAVMLIVKEVGGVREAAASGFAVSKSKILTAGHFCVEALKGQATGTLDEDIQLYFVNNNDEVASIDGAKIEAVDEKRDLCILKREKHGIMPLPLVKHYRTTKIRDSVTIVGAPFAFFPYVAYGEVMNPRISRRSRREHNHLYVSAPGTFGISGGPVINSKGEVIGVVLSKPRTFDHILFCARASTIKAFLREENE